MKKPSLKTASLRIAAALFCGAMILSGCATFHSAPKHVLVVTTTTGFRHSCIPVAEKVIAQLAARSGDFTVEFAGVDPSSAEYKGTDGKADTAKVNAAITAVLAEKMSLEALKRFDAVVFCNTTGDLPLPDKQGFIDWVKSGKGFVGMHAATDTFHGFRPYIEMIGGEFKTHGAQVSVDTINQDSKCAACRHLPASWTVFDEIYQMTSFDRASVHGLLTLDKHPNTKEPGDYPVAWLKKVGKGRVFYTSLGHREDIWSAEWKAGSGERKNTPEVSEAYQKHLLGGIRWALGLESCDAKPQSPGGR